LSTNYKQIYARKKENEQRILKVCPNCPNTSGIYFLLREENGFKFGYIGKAKHLLERLGGHLAGYKQHIDRSLKKHGLWSEENETGWKIHFLEFPESQLNEKEQYYIQKYANAGYQLRNVESGGSLGKTDIGERQPAKKYFDGVEQGKKNTREFVKHLFDLHLDYVPKKNPPTKLQEKAMQKFKDFLEVENESKID
jgi:hypothetical protein